MSKIMSSRQSGLTLVEMMIGMALGLMIISWLMMMSADHLVANQKLTADIQLQQDLRVATDIISKDLRRAGYWQDAVQATVSPARKSPHGHIAMSGTALAAQVNYRYTAKEAGALKEDDADSNAIGFRLASQAIKMEEGSSGWQEVTNPKSIRVTRLVIAPTTREVSLGHLCVPVCTNESADCPRVTTHAFGIEIAAHSLRNPSLIRQAQATVAVRNDEMGNMTCP